MKTAVRMFALALALVAAVAFPAAAQEPDQGYAIDLPAGWEQASFVDGAKIKRTEYVFNDRAKGLLKVRKIRVEPGQRIDDVVSHDVDGSIKFQPGYVQGHTERFGGGTLAGALVQFDFTRGGRPMLGRNYYLQGADGAVWVLQFTGDRETLGSIRNLTDQMARSFQEK
jgi:hypothetical protein